MNFERNRLNTFSFWPIEHNDQADPVYLANAGFYYTGQELEVQCFSCGLKISDWNHEGAIRTRHQVLNPNCPFVLNPQMSGNVPGLREYCPEGMDSSSGSLFDSLQPVSDYGVTEEDELYRSDALRLLSFVNWTDPSISREGLVSAGFYHAGEGRIRCAWCGGELERLRRLGSLGNPLQIHRRYFPGCAHAAMLAHREANREAVLSLFPMMEERNRARNEQSRSYTPPVLTPPTIASSPDNETSRSSNGHASPPRQSEGAAHNARVLAEGGTWRTLGVVGGAGGTKNPSKASLAARLHSFTSWPRDRTQTPEELADAGFFYTGAEDQVRCFYCDGGLGRWEAGDEPWREHARWFPQCGYLLLVKGPQFVAQGTPPLPAGTTSKTPRVNPENTNRVNFPFTESDVQDAMESSITAAALGAGLDAARVRRAICRRLRNTGQQFPNAESLIDAVLDDQLNEEAWSVSPQSQRLARDILAETLRELTPHSRIIPEWNDRAGSSQSDRSVRSPSPPLFPEGSPQQQMPKNTQPNEEINKVEICEELEVKLPEKKQLSLEEENRQLKEARLCKVCMDSEVSVVFLPCGHLVSCSVCGAGLRACPLCRANVHALVRAYLA